ncbi:hypothetical protein ACJIZ3_014619 [Penstemon smallii]|uniref:Uncharacterized protein n=1 Tax=Penstemon smallii TaxID=265156 RepID=A0ABD3RNA7_9LAMI
MFWPLGDITKDISSLPSQKIPPYSSLLPICLVFMVFTPLLSSSITCEFFSTSSLNIEDRRSKLRAVGEDLLHGLIVSLSGREVSVPGFNHLM